MPGECRISDPRDFIEFKPIMTHSPFPIHAQIDVKSLQSYMIEDQFHLLDILFCERNLSCVSHRNPIPDSNRCNEGARTFSGVAKITSSIPLTFVDGLTGEISTSTPIVDIGQDFRPQVIINKVAKNSTDTRRRLEIRSIADLNWELLPKHRI